MDLYADGVVGKYGDFLTKKDRRTRGKKRRLPSGKRNHLTGKCQNKGRA